MEKWKKQGVKSKEDEQKQLGGRIREKLAEERLLKKKTEKKEFSIADSLTKKGSYKF